MRHSNNRLRRIGIRSTEVFYSHDEVFIHTTGSHYSFEALSRPRRYSFEALSRPRHYSFEATTRSRPLLVRGHYSFEALSRPRHYSFEATTRSRPLLPATTRSRPLLLLQTSARTTVLSLLLGPLPYAYGAPKQYLCSDLNFMLLLCAGQSREEALSRAGGQARWRSQGRSRGT